MIPWPWLLAVLPAMWFGYVLAGLLFSATDRLRAEYERVTLVSVLVYHQRMENTGCSCGWLVYGASFAEHVADVYEMALLENA